MLQVGTVVEVLDRLSPSGPVKSTYPLTFVQLKQVRIPLLGILQSFCQVYLNSPLLYDCSYVQHITPYFSTGSNSAGKVFRIFWIGDLSIFDSPTVLHPRISLFMSVDIYAIYIYFLACCQSESSG